MRTKLGASRRGVTVKVAAVVLIVLLEVTAVLYLYMNPVQGESQNPFVIPTSTTTKSTTTSSTTTKVTTHPPADRVAVESALISNDTLTMEVRNLGPSTTQLISVRAVCSPGFQTCYDYRRLAGGYYQTRFVLPAGNTFKENMSRICVIAIINCKNYLPVANNTYYFQIRFKFADGASATVPVSAMANNTWSRYPTAIMSIPLSSLRIVPRNLTGMLNVTLTINDSLPAAATFTTLLYGYLKPSNAISGRILNNDTGCGSGFAADCSQNVSVIVNFYTVLTGIAPNHYFSLVVRDTTDIDNATGAPNNDIGHHTTWFALWLLSST
ncbi:MAG: hypothetical protein ABSB29_00335 [Nitrososphaerales archaeon]|jgi:hypothetical protein